jgi:hypothetical protein
VTILTERGYLVLVKSFTDDLAWQVPSGAHQSIQQQHLHVDNLFRVVDLLLVATNLCADFSKVAHGGLLFALCICHAAT